VLHKAVATGVQGLSKPARPKVALGLATCRENAALYLHLHSACDGLLVWSADQVRVFTRSRVAESKRKDVSRKRKGAQHHSGLDKASRPESVPS